KLKKRYRFPSDTDSARILRRAGIRAVAIPTIANLDIQPRDHALVGPRVEIYCRGIELATFVFYHSRLSRGFLEPINFVAGYGIGVERLLSIFSSTDFLVVVPRY